MYRKEPTSIRKLNATTLPLILKAADGRRMMEMVARIVETDRWNSFDRFHETTRALVTAYEAAGAETEVHVARTGGRTGSGRWIIPEAEDIVAATAEVVAPVRRKLLDYAESPWHVVQWSASTPRGGLTAQMVIADSKDELEKLGRRRLAGKVLLTSMNPRNILRQAVEGGAVAVISDQAVPEFPDAVAWCKFGWGAIPLPYASARLVGLALSANQGKKLRALAEEQGPLTLRFDVDVRKYVGSHDVVSGIVRGRDDPQDEVWAIAHSAEPGAHDNASGCAVCIEVANVLERLIADGAIPRPRRSIRLLHGYECYGFFHYLKHTRRLQPPLAGVCVDSVGARPEICDGRTEWHRTVPMSAGFVDRVGASILKATLAVANPGYRLCVEPFVATLDTLIGDPKYGYPCPWLTTHRKRGKSGFNAYHSSADTLEMLCAEGLETCATATAAYLYYLADAATPEMLELASAETHWTVRYMRGRKDNPVACSEAEYWSELHRVCLERLERWSWGGTRDEILSHMEDCREDVRRAAEELAGRERSSRRRLSAEEKRVPRRKALLTPTAENMEACTAERISDSKLKVWALYWADARRNLGEIAEMITCETGKEPSAREVAEFFQAHANLDYVELVRPQDSVTKRRLVKDLRALGVKPGMDLIVHSSLSAIGHVQGGAETVLDALLGSVGGKGTVMFPSFNHGRVTVFNPLATPTTNGAIPDAAWRRPEAVRSLHPTHAVTAIGPKAAEYCEGHLEAGVFSDDSPIGRLIHTGGCILCLGVKQIYSTAYHVAEVSLPCGCIDQWGKTEKVVDEDGRVREVKALAWRDGVCPVPASGLAEELDRRGIRRLGKVAEAEATLVKAIDLYNVRREMLRDVCPTCGIRPKRRE